MASYYKDDKSRWSVRFRVNGKQKHLRGFDTKRDAENAYILYPKDEKTKDRDLPTFGEMSILFLDAKKSEIKESTKPNKPKSAFDAFVGSIYGALSAGAGFAKIAKKFVWSAKFASAGGKVGLATSVATLRDKHAGFSSSEAATIQAGLILLSVIPGLGWLSGATTKTVFGGSVKWLIEIIFR